MKKVAVIVDGELGVHAARPDAGSDFVTLCGLDGDDPIAGQLPAEVPNGAKIDCWQCRSIFIFARTLRKTDFAIPIEPPRRLK